MPKIEVIVSGFVILFLLLAALSVLRAVMTNLKLLAYLKEHHFPRWNEFYGEEMKSVIRHIYMTPLNSEKSYFYFLLKSGEDLGDKQVRDYKRTIRYATGGFVVYAIAAVIVFGIRAWLLSQANY